MRYVRPTFDSDSDSLPRMPPWVTSARAETLEDVAFLSGAALSHLHLVLSRDDVPQALLRARLALRTAAVCVTYHGRPERVAELRDAVAFLQHGDSPGPAGEVYVSWRRAVSRPVSVKSLHRALPQVEAEQIATWLDAAQGAPIARAAAVLQAVIKERPRDHTASLLLADAAFTQALGWSHVLPLLALSLKRADLRKSDGDLRLACYRAISAAATDAVREASDLTRRVARLHAVAPKLRAKGAADAVESFLKQDAVAPSALPLPDRAARRLCDRLVDLGAVRELTGRDTFRLYGV